MRYTWFQILWFFFLYGFLGWCTEVAFQAVRQGKFVNRGFVNGPICSIYGFGVLSVLLVLEPLKDNLLMNYVTSRLLGLACAALFYTRQYNSAKKESKLYGVVCVILAIMAIIYGGMGLLGIEVPERM